MANLRRTAATAGLLAPLLVYGLLVGTGHASADVQPTVQPVGLTPVDMGPMPTPLPRALVKRGH